MQFLKLPTDLGSILPNLQASYDGAMHPPPHFLQRQLIIFAVAIFRHRSLASQFFGPVGGLDINWQGSTLLSQSCVNMLIKMISSNSIFKMVLNQLMA